MSGETWVDAFDGAAQLMNGEVVPDASGELD